MNRDDIQELILRKRKLWMDHNGWIATGSRFVAAIDEEGEVAAAGENYFGVLEIMNFGKMIAIDAGRSHCVGLKPDGTAVACGIGDGCDVWLWTELTWICAGAEHTVGLRKDGTVLAVGDNSDGQCNVGNWRDIVFVAAGGNRTVGLTSDGRILMAGKEWSQYEVPPTWENVVALYVGKGYDTAPTVYGYAQHPSNPNVTLKYSTQKYQSLADSNSSFFGDIGSMAGTGDKLLIGLICDESGLMRAVVDNTETDFAAISMFDYKGAYLTDGGKIVTFGAWKDDLVIPDEWVLYPNFSAALSNRYEMIKNGHALDEEGLTYASFKRTVAIIRDGQASKALPIIDAYKERDPDNYHVWQLQGMANIELEMYDMAIQSFRKVISLAPDDSEGYLGLSETYLKAGNPKEALKYIDEAIQRQKDDSYCNRKINLVGLVYGLDEAIAACEEYRRELPQSKLLRYAYHALMIWKAASFCSVLPSGQYAIPDEQARYNVQRYMTFADSALDTDVIQDPYIDDQIKSEWGKINDAMMTFGANDRQRKKQRIYCSECGAMLDEGSTVCPSCGRPQNGYQRPQANIPGGQNHAVPKCTYCGYVGNWIVEPLFRPMDWAIGIIGGLFTFGFGFAYFLVVGLIRSNKDRRAKICPNCKAQNMWTFIY